jgi:hypothetical protein
MADDLTPPFEEPVSSADECDEALDQAVELVIDPYDLNCWADEGDLILGFTGMLKVIHEDGRMTAFHVGIGLNQFEAVGLHRKAIKEIEEESEIDSYWREED